MIYIIRHGQTANNKAHTLQGRSNSPLNEEGLLQAQRLADRFSDAGIIFDKVYTSPLLRAVQTARIVSREAHACVKDERLIEMDYGPYEGMDLYSPLPEVAAFFRDFVHTPAPNGMEPLGQIVSRMGSFMEEIRDQGAGMNILVSTHAIAMKGALEYLTPASRGSYWSRYIGNCSVYATKVENDLSFSIPFEWNPA